MHQTQGVIYYLSDQQQVSGTKPGDRPEKSHDGIENTTHLQTEEELLVESLLP